VSISRSLIDLFSALGFLAMAYSFGVKRLELQTKLGKNYSRLNDN
jgi:hypothetical protein